MALVTANGLAVLEAAICIPRVGAWHADLRIDTADTITGPVTISIDDGRLVLQGTVWRGAAFAGTSSVRVVAGADGLRKTARARHYQQTSLRIVLADLLADAGEKLAGSASASALARRLPAWTTTAISVGRLAARAISVASPGTTWRMLPDGTFWLGSETWPDSGFTEETFATIDENPAAAEAFIAPDAPLLLPGTTLLGRRVSYVEHTVNSQGIRTKVFFESDDRVKDALAAAVKASLPPMEYFARHWARVIAQHGATIDVEIENPTIAKVLPSMSGVPLLMPAPGAAMQMAATGRVLIGWSGGDPSKPYAIGYESATALVNLVLNAPALSLGDEAAQPFPNLAYRTAESALFTAIAGIATTAAGASLDAGAVAFFTALAGLLTPFEAAATSYLTTKAKAT